MVRTSGPRAADLRGINSLTIDGIVGLVDLVEAMHYSIASIPGMLAKRTYDRTSGITGLVYRSIRGVRSVRHAAKSNRGIQIFCSYLGGGYDKPGIGATDLSATFR
jgi:hypothetical protein